MVSKPDITPAQIVAAVGAIVGLLVSNLVINSHTGKLITELAAIVVPAAWMIADAIIRHGRAHAAAAVVASSSTSGEAKTKLTEMWGA